MQNNDLTDRLAATAAGTWGEEAAVWLLTEHAHWLTELERGGLILEQPMARGGVATLVHWGRCEPGDRANLMGSPSEWQVLRVARTLAADHPQPLGSLTSLDEDNRRLVLHAVAWAAGGRGWAKSLGLLRGRAGQ